MKNSINGPNYEQKYPKKYLEKINYFLFETNNFITSLYKATSSVYIKSLSKKLIDKIKIGYSIGELRKYHHNFGKYPKLDDQSRVDSSCRNTFKFIVGKQNKNKKNPLKWSELCEKAFGTDYKEYLVEKRTGYSKWNTIEKRKKMMSGIRKYWNDTEEGKINRRNQSARMKNKYKDPIERRKQSIRIIKVNKNPEFKSRRSLIMKNKYKDPIERRKQSIRIKNKWKDPNYRKKQLLARKKNEV